MFDPMAELTGRPASHGVSSDAGTSPRGEHRGSGRFADELHSISIHGRQRTFYIDLKESGNGKFFKVSEKSRGGQKTTIMFDAEDLPKFIEAFQEMQTKLST